MDPPSQNTIPSCQTPGSTKLLTPQKRWIWEISSSSLQQCNMCYCKAYWRYILCGSLPLILNRIAKIHIQHQPAHCNVFMWIIMSYDALGWPTEISMLFNAQRSKRGLLEANWLFQHNTINTRKVHAQHHLLVLASAYLDFRGNHQRKYSMEFWEMHAFTILYTKWMYSVSNISVWIGA